MPSPHLLAPLLAIAAIVICSAVMMYQERRVRPSTVGWLIVPTFALAWLAVWASQGLYDGPTEEIIAFCFVALIAAAAILTRHHVRDLLARLHPAIRICLGCLAVAGCTGLSFVALELPLATEGTIQILPESALFDLALIFGILLVLLLVSQRHGIGIAIGTTVFALAGAGSAFVAEFKYAAILPGDLFVLGTAAAVAGNYEYVFTAPMLQALACWLLTIALSSLVLPTPATTNHRRSLAVNSGAAIVCLGLLALTVTVPSYRYELGIDVSYWNTLSSYRKYGFLPSFITAAQDMSIEEPEGYSPEAAADLERDYVSIYDETRGASEQRTAAQSQFDELQPSVIYVVNESFSDLTCLSDTNWGYEGPVRFNSVDDALLRGSIATSVTGGATCNSEFELLTGVSFGYLGEGKSPLVLYNLSESPSVVRQFKELGYATTAMHPNLPTNYNRMNAYPDLGFDTFLSLEDFEGCAGFHSGVSDAETYKKVLQILEENDEPQFIYDLTMQNHSGYNLNNIGDVPQYAVDGLSSGQIAELSEYLACIEESDRALEEFITELEKLDRPVVLVFVGDHQPVCAPSLNDVLNPDESSFVHDVRLYETSYMVWANYDVAGSDQSSLKQASGLSFLSAQALEAIGAPLTDFQKSQLITSEELHSISLVSVRDDSDSWHPIAQASAVSSRFDGLAQITYLEFASKLR